MDEATDIETRKPSKDVVVLLNQLDSADPDSEDVDKDDANENWGHMQFTGGGLTICSALVDWEVVGNTSMAFKLIAVAARMCKVARALCAVKGQSPRAYLADEYFDLLLMQLQRCWEGAQVSISTLHCFSC